MMFYEIYLKESLNNQKYVGIPKPIVLLFTNSFSVTLNETFFSGSAPRDN